MGEQSQGKWVPLRWEYRVERLEKALVLPDEGDAPLRPATPPSQLYGRVRRLPRRTTKPDLDAIIELGHLGWEAVGITGEGPNGANFAVLFKRSLAAEPS